MAPVAETCAAAYEEGTVTSLERCVHEQTVCGDYLRSGGPDQAGAYMGACDWLMEEAILRREYSAFLDRKSQLGGFSGFDPLWMPGFLFDFQQDLVDWSIRKGKAAIFADCGLGKTPMQLVWADNVVRKTGKRVLIITPLAVGAQTIREAEKFNIEARKAVDGYLHPGINVTNYERLHYFNPEDFSGVVLDESSILKSFDGKRRSEITEFMRTRPYRLLCTATAAPNDYIELGTSSEALGQLGHTDMLGRFFKNDQNTIQPMRHHIIGKNFRDPAPMVEKWRFKGHAEVPFWRWVCSWARAIRRPSDLGYDDKQFILPELREEQHLVTALTLAEGMLFAIPAVGLKEQRDERKRTITERCEKVAELVIGTKRPALVWCHLNVEGDLLEDTLADAVQVSGDDSDEAKEEKFLGFTSGQIRILVTKPKIGAWGLNFQHCNHVTFFPSHSFEQYYQGVRRCWRFGQMRPVKVDIVTTEGEQSVMENLQRKATAADTMFSALVAQMRDALAIERSNKFTTQETVPSWL
jgi:hypothetical protein